MLGAEWFVVGALFRAELDVERLFLYSALLRRLFIITVGCGEVWSAVWYAEQGSWG